MWILGERTRGGVGGESRQHEQLKINSAEPLLLTGRLGKTYRLLGDEGEHSYITSYG